MFSGYCNITVVYRVQALHFGCWNFWNHYCIFGAISACLLCSTVAYAATQSRFQQTIIAHQFKQWKQWQWQQQQHRRQQQQQQQQCGCLTTHIPTWMDMTLPTPIANANAIAYNYLKLDSIYVYVVYSNVRPKQIPLFFASSVCFCKLIAVRKICTLRYRFREETFEEFIEWIKKLYILN